jgi:hypothetical protein
MKKIPVFPTYRQELGDGRFRIIKIAVINKAKVSACCKEYENENDDNPMIYHHSAKRTSKGETLSQLKQLAKDYYNIKEEEKINC